MIAWALESLAASAVLMALVMMLRGSVRRAFGAQVGYALWALPALRLAMPPLPEAWHHAAPLPLADAGAQVAVLFVPAAAEPTLAAAAPVAAAPAMDWPLMLTGAWAIGAGLLVAWQLAVHGRFCRRILARARRLEPVDGIPVVASAAAAGPLAFGVTRRWIAVPVDWADRFCPDERALALAHERAHHRRGDLLANWAALGVLALHWFNPLAWAAYKAFRADQEMATDAAVLAGRPAAARADYAAALIKAAAGGSIQSACHLNTLDDLKRRLRMLSTARLSRRRLAAGRLSIAGLAATGLALTATGASPAAAVRAQVDKALDADLPAIPEVKPMPELTQPMPSMPAMPAMPAHPTRRMTHALAAPMPPMVPLADMSPTPPLPPAPLVASLAGRHGTVMVRTVDGTTRTIHVDVPIVYSRPCGGAGPSVINSLQGRTKVVTVCTDRITAEAKRGAELAANSETIHHDAIAQALVSLRHARESLTANQHMMEATRTRALAAIDRSMAELGADTH